MSQPSRPTTRRPLVGRAAHDEIKRGRTRTKLLRAAFALFGQADGRNTQIDDITRAAETSRGTFYNYFDSRDELLNVLAIELNHGLDQALASAPDPVTRTCWAVRFYIRKAALDRPWARAMVNVSANGVRAFGDDTYRYATETLEAGVASGDFRLDSLQAGLDIVMGTTLHAVRTISEGHSVPKHAENVARLVLLALGVTRGRAERLVNAPLPIVIVEPSAATLLPLPMEIVIR